MSNVEIDLDEFTIELDRLKDAQARYKFELKQVEKKIDEYESALGLFLKQSKLNNIVHGRYEFGFVERTRRALDQQLLKEKYPEQFNDCYVEKTQEKFEFKIL